MRLLKPLLLLTLFTTSVLAQNTSHPDDNYKKNELGFLLGARLTPSQRIDSAVPVPDHNIDLPPGLSFQATYARHIAGQRKTALYIELPFVASPSIHNESGTATVPKEYASLFFTPGIRVKFAPKNKVAPWLALGGGYGRFDEANQGNDRLPNLGRRGTNTAALQFGGGLDFKTPVKILFPIGLRVEARDFYSGKPNYNFSTGGGGQHNVVVSGGFTVSF